MGTRIRETLLLAALRLIHRFDKRQPDPGLLGTAAIRRILIMSSTAIGDTLLSTPAFTCLRNTYPAAHISLLLNAAYRPLFAAHPAIDQIIPYYGGYRRFLRLAWQLRHEHFDLVVLLHANEPQATPLAYLSGAPFRFKLPNNNDFAFLLSNPAPVYRWEDLGHGVEQRLAVARLAGATIASSAAARRMTMPVTAVAQADLETRLATQGIPPDAELIGLQAGASTVSRRWEAENFAHLAQRLLAQSGTRPRWIVLTGSPAERELANRIAALTGLPQVWNAAGELPLATLPALMLRLDVLVTGDTGPMHLAVSVETPVVALFAVADWRRSGPAHDLDKHFVIQKNRTCDPCYSKRCPYAAPPCMAAITVDEVQAAVESRLQHQSGGVSDNRPEAVKASFLPAAFPVPTEPVTTVTCTDLSTGPVMECP